MARSTEPLAVGRVIGDVIDMFIPSAEMVVAYPARQVNNGCEIKVSAVTDRPRVQIGGQDGLYTLVMTDPDAPSPSEPLMREVVHWIVTDIPAGTDATYGREILTYEAPKPMIGIHRYVFVLFKQLGPLVVMPPLYRNNFNSRDFAITYDLGFPAAAVYFNCQKQAGGRRR
uniref:Flowering locus T/terminal flower 1-2 n=1 Tax=Anemia villosa TaxID=148560 RepID=A0A8E7IJF7_9MONI|nr:flowering locus T/terminal flower 1-2 [Anemia villosa]